MRTRTTDILTAVTVLLLLFGPSAKAEGTATGKLEVSAVVVPNCRFTLTPLTFGAYDPLAAHRAQPLDATAKLLLTCTRSSQATIAMDIGRNPVGGSGMRGLAMADQVLAYQLFRDSSMTQVWAHGADSMRFSSDAAGSDPREFTIYGQIPPAQSVRPGVYVDVVTATVDF